MAKTGTLNTTIHVRLAWWCRFHPAAFWLLRVAVRLRLLDGDRAVAWGKAVVVAEGRTARFSIGNGGQWHGVGASREP